MDQEISFAADAELDYWAFLVYPESNPMSVALKQYLKSPERGRINFCLILHNSLLVSDEQWPKERDRAVALLKQPGYQKVLDGRPLVAVDGEEPWEGMLLAALLPHLSESREAGRILTARAMLHLAAGNTDQARQDLLACHRLARLVGQGPTLVEGLVGFAIDRMAYAGDVQLAHRGKLGAKAIRDWKAELQRLPPHVKMADKMDIGERFAFLDVVCALARSRPVSEGMKLLSVVQALSYLSVGEDSRLWLRVLDTIVAWMCDWDHVTHLGNRFYDRLVAAAREPSRADRVAALGELNKEIQCFSSELRDPKSFRDDLLALKSPRRMLSERIGKVLLSLFGPALSVCVDSEDRHTTLSELTQLALTLAAYRAEHEAYPKQLADLVPAHVHLSHRTRSRQDMEAASTRFQQSSFALRADTPTHLNSPVGPILRWTAKGRISPLTSCRADGQNPGLGPSVETSSAGKSQSVEFGGVPPPQVTRPQ